jgi:hypothetical protein
MAAVQSHTHARCLGCDGPLPPRARKWCSERCRKAKYSRPCIDCGGAMTGCNGNGPAAPVRCRECNVTYTRSLDYRRNLKHNRERKWTDEQIFEWVRRYPNSREYGEAVKAAPGTMPSMPCIMYRFHRWNLVLEAAGIEPPHPVSAYRGRLTERGALLAVLDCQAAVGRVPTYGDYKAWAAANDAPSGTLVRMRLGGWHAVIDALAPGAA